MAISCTEFTLKLRVNGEQLSNQSCAGTVSYPSLAVNFNTSFELHVYHNPYDICLDVYMRLPTTWVGMLPSVISSVLIASVGVPITMSHEIVSVDKDSADEMMGNTRVNKKMSAMKHATLAAVFSPSNGWLVFASNDPISAPDLYGGNSLSGLIPGLTSGQPMFRPEVAHLQVELILHLIIIFVSDYFAFYL